MAIERHHFSSNFQSQEVQGPKPPLASGNQANAISCSSRVYDAVVQNDLLTREVISASPVSLNFHSEVRKTDRDFDVELVFKENIYTDAKLSLKAAVALKIEGKVTDWFTKEVKKEDFKSFKSLKQILVGKNEKLVDELVKQISSEISEAEATHISPQQIRKVIYSKAARVAQDLYLIDQETIKNIEGKRGTGAIRQKALEHKKAMIIEIPEFSCQANLLDKSELHAKQKQLTNLIKILEKSNKNPQALEKARNELEVIQKVLEAWEERHLISGEISLAKQSVHAASVDNIKILRLQIFRDKLLEELKNTSAEGLQEEILSKLSKINSTLELIEKYPQIQAMTTKTLYSQFCHVSPLYIDIKQLGLIPPGNDTNPLLARCWNHVLDKSKTISEISDNPRAKVIARNKYLEALQTLVILNHENPGNNGTLFKEILEKHGLPIGGENKIEVSSEEVSKQYRELRDSEALQMISSSKKTTFITSAEAKNLNLLSKCILWGRLDKQDKLDRISDKEKRDFEKFLFSALNNSEFNSRIMALSKEHIPMGISTEAIEFIKNYSYKSRYHGQFIKVVAKADKIIDHLHELEQYPDEKKLSLKEFGILKQAADLSKNFKTLQQAGLLRDRHYLKILADKVFLAEEVIDKLNDAVQKEIDEKNIYRSGDVAAWHSFKWQEFLVKKPTREVELMRKWITEIGHGSCLYRSKDKDVDGISKTMQSHIYGTYENEPLNAHQIAFSEIWRLDLAKLINTSSPIYKVLEKVYDAKGLNAAEEIQKLYEEVCREVHEEKKDNFEDMENEEARRFAAGWADYGFEGGHKRKVEKSDHYHKVHSQFFEGPKNPGEKKWVICSEFVTKATIATLIETDIRLVNLINDYVKENSDNLAAKTMADELIKYSANDGMHVIELPYDKSERLKRVHPGRMIALLQDKDCVHKVEIPSTIIGAFTAETFNSKLKTKTLVEKHQKAETLISKGNFSEGLLVLDIIAKTGAPVSYYNPIFTQFGLRPGEWSEIASQKANIKDPFFNSNIHFTQLEVDALKIIGRIDTDRSMKSQPSLEEKYTLLQFFAHIAQNECFNSRIVEFARAQAKNDPKMKVFNSNAFGFMREFSFKTHHLMKLNELAPRFQKVWEAVRDNREDELKDNECLVLHDYRMIDSFSNMSSFLSWASKRGLTENTFLGTMKNQVEGMQTGMDIINQRFRQEAVYDTGDIILDVMDKAEMYDSKPFDPTNKVDWLLKVQKGVIGHQFQHAAIAVRKGENIQMAEMDIAYQNPIVEVGRLCIADVYRLDLSKMIDLQSLAILRSIEKNKGISDIATIDSNITKKVEAKFKDILTEVMSNDDQFKELSNSAFRQVTTILRAANSTTRNDLSKLGFESPQEVVCSEFVARVYGHVIHRVNAEIREEMKQGLMMSKKISAEDADVALEFTQILQNPITEMNFAAVHADKLYDIFEPYLQLVEPPKFIKRIQSSV